MKSLRLLSLAVSLCAVLVLSSGARAQSGANEGGSGTVAQATDDGKIGWLETVEGTPSTIGQAVKIDSSANYKFNPLFNASVGVPFYYIRNTDTTTTGTKGTTAATTNNGLGNFYVQLQANAPLPLLGITSTLTGYAPTGSKSKGLSTGRVTFDWDNRLEHTTMLILTPFVDVGIANSLTDSKHFTRPFTTLGKVGHVEGGLEVKMSNLFTLGGSGYDIIPIGAQTMYSKVLKSGSSGNSSHNRAFEGSAVTSGGPSLVRDYGFSGYVDTGVGKVVSVELGFTRSVHYAMNSADVTVSCNMGKLLHSVR